MAGGRYRYRYGARPILHDSVVVLFQPARLPACLLARSVPEAWVSDGPNPRVVPSDDWVSRRTALIAKRKRDRSADEAVDTTSRRLFTNHRRTGPSQLAPQRHRVARCRPPQVHSCSPRCPSHRSDIHHYLLKRPCLWRHIKLHYLPCALPPPLRMIPLGELFF
jgi:hypothetical protein